MNEPEYETVDERTGEIIPKGSPPTLPARDLVALQVNANSIGTLELSEETERILDEKLDPKEVKIRPDGLVYLPWTWYAQKLNSAFGRLKWGMIPQGAPQSKETGNNSVLVIWGNWLVIKGIPVGFAFGETSYRTDNSTMSYADAIEGAKSISLARNCKVLGIALELWDADWTATWKKEFAETYEGRNGKTLWRKRGEKPAKVESVVSKESPAVSGDVDKDFPKIQFSPKEIKNSAEYVARIAKDSGKKIPEVMALIKTLDSTKEYSIKTIVEMLKGS